MTTSCDKVTLPNTAAGKNDKNGKSKGEKRQQGAALGLGIEALDEEEEGGGDNQDKYVDSLPASMAVRLSAAEVSLRLSLSLSLSLFLSFSLGCV